jgi:hypothetical protein
VSETLLLTPSDSLAPRGIAKRGRRRAVKVKTNREIEETEKKVIDHTGRFESEARSARCEMPVIPSHSRVLVEPIYVSRRPQVEICHYSNLQLWYPSSKLYIGTPEPEHHAMHQVWCRCEPGARCSRTGLRAVYSQRPHLRDAQLILHRHGFTLCRLRGHVGVMIQCDVTRTLLLQISLHSQMFAYCFHMIPRIWTYIQVQSESQHQ